MNLSFYKIERKDLEWARKLHNDPEVLQNLSDTRKVNKKQQSDWFQKLEADNKRQRLVVKDGNKKIGLIRLDQIDYQNKSVCVGLDIDGAYRGQGYSVPIYKKLFSFLFKENDYHRVWLLVADYNLRARHIYIKLGFKEEGIQRKSLLRNRNYSDMIMMSILQEEYNEL